MKFNPIKLRKPNLEIENFLIKSTEVPIESLLDYSNDFYSFYILNETSISGGRLFNPSFIGSDVAPHDLHPVVLML